MLGRRIDRAALTLVGATGLYLYFLNMGRSIAVSGILAFVCASLARYVLRHRPGARRITRKQAEAALASITLDPGDAAAEALRTLSGSADATLLVRHAEGTFTLNELYEIWREKGDGVSVVVSCAAEPGAAAFAKARGMRLVDREALLKRIRATGFRVSEDAPEAPLADRVKALWRRLRLRPRMALYGLCLMSAYLVTGQPLCLVCALGLAGVAGAKAIEKWIITDS